MEIAMSVAEKIKQKFTYQDYLKWGDKERMRNLSKLVFWLLVVVFLYPIYTYSACSNYRDFVIINEVNTKSGNVELYILPNIVPANTTFTIKACNTNNTICNSKDITYTGTTNYIFTSLSTIENNKDYIDIVVKIGNDVVDYLNLYVNDMKILQLADAKECGFDNMSLYPDRYIKRSNKGQREFYRSPDGSSNWVETSHNTNNTFGSSNVATTQPTITPIANWRFDECSYNGTLGEVKDFSGNNINGTSKTANSVGEIAQTDYYGVVGRSLSLRGEGYNASPNNAWYEADSYVEFPDHDNLSNIASNGITITGWFNVRTTTGTQTILHKGGGTTGTQEYRIYLDNGKINAMVWDQYGGSTTLLLDHVISSNVNYFFSFVSYISNNNLIMKLYLISSTNTYSVASIKSGFIYTLSQNRIGNLLVGATKWSTITNFFDGKIDEINLFSGPLSSTQIVNIRNNELSGKNWDGANRSIIICGLISHYLIVHDGTGLTCQPESVTIKACVDANCTQTYNASSTVTLNKNGTSIGTYTFTGSTTGSVSQQTPATVSLSLTNLNPVAPNGFKCDNLSGLPADNFSQCNITFYDSGFKFKVPDNYSCIEQSVSISAVAKDPLSYKCVPAFQNKTLPINFTYSYVNPSTNPYNTKPKINDTDLNTTINLYFNENGEAFFRFKYPDAGQIKIIASYDNLSSGVKAVGDNTTIVRPAGFYVYTTTPNWQATDHNSTVFKKAGEGFDLRARAVCWEMDNDSDLSNNAITHNYDNRTVNISHNLIQPIGGASGSIGISQMKFTGGLASIDNQTFSEVGIIKFTLTDNDYLGSGYNITGTSENIGRFIPYKFKLSDKGTVKNYCNNFTYFNYDNLTIQNVKIQAVNRNDQITRNYTDNFTKFNELDYNEYKFSTDSGLSLQKGIDNVSGNWSNGELTFSASFKFFNLHQLNQNFLKSMLR